MARKPVDPLITATRRARRQFASTPLGQLQRLVTQRTKWRRRETIAQNQLKEIEDQIDQLATELAGRKDTWEPD